MPSHGFDLGSMSRIATCRIKGQRLVLIKGIVKFLFTTESTLRHIIRLNMLAELSFLTSFLQQ